MPLRFIEDSAPENIFDLEDGTEGKLLLTMGDESELVVQVVSNPRSNGPWQYWLILSESPRLPKEVVVWIEASRRAIINYEFSADRYEDYARFSNFERRVLVSMVIMGHTPVLTIQAPGGGGPQDFETLRFDNTPTIVNWKPLSS